MIVRAALACLVLLPVLASCASSEGDGADALPGIDVPEVGDAVPEATDAPAPSDVTVAEAVDWTGGGPSGNVYLASPVDGATARVALRHLADDQRLTGAYVQAFNCLRDDAAERNPLSGMKVCTPTQTALAGPDGSWLHVQPPADPAAVDDAFAEVQMYFHVDRVHDYFASTHGASRLDLPIPAIVNFGLDEGEGWQVYDNAAFMPEATVGIYGFDLDTAEGAIVFGQGEHVDYCYDASVIYHEYTHALTGQDRLFGYAADEQGFNAEPFSMNEAFADYFAATLMNDPVLGRFALVDDERDASRDLSELRTCPEHLLGEVHYDGRIWASALWAFRGEVGPEVADAVIFDTLMACGGATTFADASALLLERAASRGSEVEAAARAALEARRLTDCRRVKPWQDVAEPVEREPLLVPGRLSSGVPALNQLTTMAYQFVVEVPEGTTAATLRYTAEAGMGWQGPLDLQVAVRHGTQVLHDYPNGKLKPVADAVLPSVAPVADGEPWTVDLAGPWLVPGPLYLHVLSRMLVDVELTSVQLTLEP